MKKVYTQNGSIGGSMDLTPRRTLKLAGYSISDLAVKAGLVQCNEQCGETICPVPLKPGGV